ncbi:hypothetical protein [Lacihabitans soyangensis]|uniref:Uncharacterized protein n=1 Tax=Lacihabitans soyangensis TaxID=869394 RepID=A0AAE3KXS0_9BACT|nr:hypothetical protein [Lacihabitans soyangensis]MCP9765640.1 hypothetical protein [Lacihabitans soyangensis]
MGGISHSNEHKKNVACLLSVFITNKFEEQIEQNLSEGAVAYDNNFDISMPKSEIKAWMRQKVHLSIGLFRHHVRLGYEQYPYRENQSRRTLNNLRVWFLY